MNGLFDLLGAAFLALFAPVLKLLARRRHVLPHVQGMSDRIGIQLRSTHYYEPTYRLSDLPADTKGERHLPGIRLNAESQIALLRQLRYGAELAPLPLTPPGPGRFGWRNGMYEFGDGEIYYGLVRYLRPARIIEIGSGSSTLLALAAAVANLAEDSGAKTEITCIEPYANAWLAGSGAKLVAERVEDLDPALFDTLEAGDVLFIDSSHVIRPFGDVTYEILQVLPRLKPGVWVHIHDIFTPRDYHEEWLRGERRLWNEQYMLEAWLSGNRQVEIVCALNWLKHNHFDELAAACPLLGQHPETEPGAFWMRTG